MKPTKASYYVAGYQDRAEDAQRLARALQQRGHRVTSRWHDTGERHADEATMTEARLDMIAHENLADLDAADALVWLVDPRSRGALVEVGYAHGRRKRIVAVGHFGGVTPMARGCYGAHVPDVAALLALLDGTPA